MSLALQVLGYAALGLLLLLAVLYKYFTRRFGYWKQRGVHELRPLPFVGNIKDIVFLRQSIGQFAKQVYEESKSLPYIGVYAFDEPLLLINDLDLVKAVLVKDFSHFYDRSFHVSEERDALLGKSLFALKGEPWKKQRTVFGPSFTSGKMKRMFAFVEKSARTLAEVVEKESNGEKPMQIYELAARYTTEVIASCAFGIEANTLRDPCSEFRRMLARFFQFSDWEGLKWTATFLAPELMFTFRLKLLKPDVDEYVIGVIGNTIRLRQKEGVRRHDFLDNLVQVQKTGHIQDDDSKVDQKKVMDSLTREEEVDVASQALMILLAGFETSATTMSMVLFELARHPDVQQRLREEIATAVDDDGALSYEKVMTLKYLDMVTQEALRKYPPLPFLDRVASRSYTLPGTGLTLDKGTRVLVSAWGIQMDPDIFPNPTDFDPERFSDEAKASRHSMAHIPFGEGPRICAGLRFAMMQTKTGLAHLLHNYSVHLCSETPEEMQFNPLSFLLQPRPFKLVFRKL